MMKKVLSRLKNKKVILAVVAGVLAILVNLGIIDMEMSKKVDEIVNLGLGVLIAVGILSNPDSHLKEEE